MDFPRPPADRPRPDPPEFHYRYLGQGVYEVRGRLGLLGRIYTTARVAFSRNPRAWGAAGVKGIFDSMADAAKALLLRPNEALGDYMQWLITRRK